MSTFDLPLDGAEERTNEDMFLRGSSAAWVKESTWVEDLTNAGPADEPEKMASLTGCHLLLPGASSEAFLRLRVLEP